MSRSKVPKSKLRQEEEEEAREDHQSNKHEGLVLFPDKGSNGNTANNNSSSKSSNNTKKKNNGNGNADEDDEEQYDVSTPAAWTAMQRSLHMVTPYLPLWTRGNAQQRYERLRPHLPRNCILLPEILNGSHDLKLSSSSDHATTTTTTDVDPDPPNTITTNNKNHYLNHKYLCVWVDSIEEQNSHHGIWTVELKDETGATIRAWMEPNFVKEELQKAATTSQQQQAPAPLERTERTSSSSLSNNNKAGVVRVGVVWMLANVSMIAINTTDNSSSSNTTNNNDATNNTGFGGGGGGVVERMLVVSRKHILRVWTPELDKAQHQPNEEEDSPEKQRNYLDWMEQRNALTTADNRNIPNNDDDDTDDDTDDDDDADDDADDGPPEKEVNEMEEEEGGHGNHHHHHHAALDRRPQEVTKIRHPDDNDEPTATQKNGHRSSRRIVGGKEHQERMIEMSALTMTAADEESSILGTSQQYNNSGDDGQKRSNESGMQPTRSPLAHRKVNPRDSSRVAITNSGNGRNKSESDNLKNNEAYCDDENHPTPSVLLHTQESTLSVGKDKMRAAQQQQEQQHSQRSRDSSQHQQQHDEDDQRLTQPYPAQRNDTSDDNGNQRSSTTTTIDCNSALSPGLSPREQHPRGDPSIGRTHKEMRKSKKKMKKTDDANSSSPIRDRAKNSHSPKRTRENHRGSACSSPIRMSQAVWNTLDPSILEMLEEEDEDSDGSADEEEVKTVIWETPSSSFIPTQSSNKHQHRILEVGSNRGETETSTQGGSKGNDDEANGNESPLLMERSSLGEKLFEPSNWEGVDVAAAFDESDD
jgi:hypothetical protein